MTWNWLKLILSDPEEQADLSINVSELFYIYFYFKKKLNKWAEHYNAL